MRERERERERERALNNSKLLNKLSQLLVSLIAKTWQTEKILKTTHKLSLNILECIPFETQIKTKRFITVLLVLNKKTIFILDAYYVN